MIQFQGTRFCKDDNYAKDESVNVEGHGLAAWDGPGTEGFDLIIDADEDHEIEVMLTIDQLRQMIEVADEARMRFDGQYDWQKRQEADAEEETDTWTVDFKVDGSQSHPFVPYGYKDSDNPNPICNVLNCASDTAERDGGYEPFYQSHPIHEVER